MNSWGHIDKRFMEGRRRHILEEYTKLQKLEAQEAKIFVVGAGFIGVIGWQSWSTSSRRCSSPSSFSCPGAWDHCPTAPRFSAPSTCTPAASRSSTYASTTPEGVLEEDRTSRRS